MDSSQIASIIKRRQTWKVLAPVDQPIIHSRETLDRGDDALREAIAVAGWAPFHYDRAVDGVKEPWRVHVLDQTKCRSLATEFAGLFPDIKPTNKLPTMLSACGALALVTWLPQFSHGAHGNNDAVAKDKQTQVDEEHLAATSAYVQNLMLLLTADGFGTYWSSGGQFRTMPMFEHLSIPANERLLAAVFVDYASDSSSPERIAGKLQDQRSPSDKWTRWV